MKTNRTRTRRTAFLTAPLLSLLVAILSGCANTGASVPAQVNASGPVGTSSAVPSSASARLNYEVRASANDVFSRTVADQVRTETEGALNQAGFRGDGKSPDIRVDFNVSTNEFDRSGNYYRYEGTAKGLISRVYDDKPLAARTLDLRGSRGLGEAAALNKLGTELAAETSRWVMDSATPETIGLSASDISVTLPWYKDVYANRAMDDYARKFVRVVSEISGVTSVLLTEEDPRERRLTFRVVYLPGQFPAGLLNHLKGLSGKNDLNLD